MKKATAVKFEDKIGYFKAKTRCLYNQILTDGLNSFVSGNLDLAFLKKIEQVIASYPSKDEPEMQALLRDITSTEEKEGRITKAFSSKGRVIRWGLHYIRSMIRAHQLQQCHNFMDPGVQVYGGNLFKTLREKADKIFCSLPPADPSRKKQAEKYALAQAHAPPPVQAPGQFNQKICKYFTVVVAVAALMEKEV